MKIAVASEGKEITQHFGHCENFNIFHIDNKEIVESESIPNPGHRPGFLPVFLKDLGIDIIISGGMGGSAIEIFNQNNIDVITGAKGGAREAVEDYLKGDLESSGVACHSHRE